MTREIKFRAWDGDAKIFVYSDQDYDDYFFEFKDGTLKAFRIVDTPNTIYEPLERETQELEPVQQYTGRNDDNGKKVYEKDIIEGNLYDKRLPTMGMIVYDLMHACYANKNEGGLTPLSRIAMIEVIGNIYENPEC